MNRKESCVEKLVEMLHQEDAIPGVPGVLPCFLKPARTLLHRPIFITVLVADARIKMVMLLGDDMAGLDARADRRTWAPWLSFPGDGTTCCSINTRRPKIIYDPPSLVHVYVHASRRKHAVQFVIVSIGQAIVRRGNRAGCGSLGGRLGAGFQLSSERHNRKSWIGRCFIRW